MQVPARPSQPCEKKWEPRLTRLHRWIQFDFSPPATFYIQWEPERTTKKCFSFIRVSWNGGIQKWLVYNGTSHWNWWVLGVPLFQVTTILLPWEMAMKHGSKHFYGNWSVSHHHLAVSACRCSNRGFQYSAIFPIFPHLIFPLDPSTFLGSIWGMRVKYLRKHCLDASGLTFGRLVKFGEPKVVKQLDHLSIYLFLLTHKLKRLSRFFGTWFWTKKLCSSIKPLHGQFLAVHKE